VREFFKISFVFYLFSGVCCYAQQDPQLSQYMFNGMILNPAYAGSHQYTSASILQRNQWVSFDGAPKTSLFLIDGPLYKEKMGLGLEVANDRIGVTNETDVYANYSYHLKLAKNKLSFGLKGGFSNYTTKYSTLKVWDENDNAFLADRQTALLPKIGFGMYYYAEKYYAGFSIPSMIVFNPINNQADISGSDLQRKHYYFTGGYVYDLNEIITLKPSVLVKYLPSAPVQVDLNLNVLLYNVLWLGASYRTGDAIVGMAEYQAFSKLRIGYAFDYSISGLNGYTGGTHEIMIAFDFRKEVIKTVNPRYF